MSNIPGSVVTLFKLLHTGSVIGASSYWVYLYMFGIKFTDFVNNFWQIKLLL